MSIPPRTTSQRVKSVLNRDYDSVDQPDLGPYIEGASSMIDQVVVEAAKVGRGISDTGVGSTAEILERWLACHLYQMSDQGYASRSTAGASGSFRGQSGGDGLKATNYGRTALGLDPSGMLNALFQAQRARGFYAGTPPDQQIDNASNL